MAEPVIVKKQNQEVSELVDLKIIPRDLLISGEQSIVKVIRCTEGEGFLVSTIAEMTNVSERAVWKHIYRCAISTVPMGPQSLRSLKDSGVLFVHARRAAFVPKNGVKQLLKLISTPEAWAIYYQLWNNSERLQEVEQKLLEIGGQLQAALNRSAIDHAKLRMQEQKAADLEEQLLQQIVHLEAKLETAGHQLSFGGNRKVPKFNLPTYVRAPDDIFKKPSYTISLVKKSVSEMSTAEHKRFALQHSSKVAVGVSGSLIRTMNDLGVNNPIIRDKADILQAAARDLHSEIMPSDAGLRALNRTKAVIYDQ